MPLSLLNHSALALFSQRTRIPTSARSIGFCAIWVCISSSSSSAHGHTCDVASPTKNPIMKVTVDVKNAQAKEKTRGSDMVAEGMMEVHTAHATSTPVKETSKALK